jgi:hypothetical protein
MLKKVGPNVLKAAMLLHVLRNLIIGVIHYLVKGKVKIAKKQATKAKKVHSARDRGGWSTPLPGRFTLPV